MREAPKKRHVSSLQISRIWDESLVFIPLDVGEAVKGLASLHVASTRERCFWAFLVDWCDGDRGCFLWSVSGDETLISYVVRCVCIFFNSYFYSEFDDALIGSKDSIAPQKHIISLALPLARIHGTFGSPDMERFPAVVSSLSQISLISWLDYANYVKSPIYSH